MGYGKNSLHFPYFIIFSCTRLSIHRFWAIIALDVCKNFQYNETSRWRHNTLYKELVSIITLDYTIESPEERLKLVNQILAETPEPNEQYLEILSDYLVLCMEKQEKKEKKILTENRMATINKREISYESLVDQLENGEDGIYNLITDNGKNTIFQPKVTITKQDIEEIPQLRRVRESIEFWERLQKTASGRAAYIIKSTLIELRKDQYVIKNAYRRPIVFTKISRGMKTFPPLPFDEWIERDATGTPSIHYSGISFCDHKVINEILQLYPMLKSRSQGCFEGDTWYMIQDFTALVERALAEYPMYQRIVQYKQDKYQNIEIQAMLESEFQFTHSIEYISSLWRNKIPKLIAQKAQEEWLTWYFTYVEKGQWKRCSRCGEIKLAHSKFFSINKTSKDHFYSICKKCRNNKKKEC